MGMPIGNAEDFYRLRVIRVDESDGLDLEWRDDILYRRPPAGRAVEYDVYRVEAVDVDDEERVSILRDFGTDDEARCWLQVVEADLAIMTRSEFERTYFVDAGPDADSSAEDEPASGRAARSAREGRKTAASDGESESPELDFT